MKRLWSTFEFALFLPAVLLSPAASSAQGIQSFSIGARTSSLPLSNSVDVLFQSRDTLWAGSGKGLSQTMNGGQTWNHFPNTQSFDEKGISAMAGNDKIICAASAFSQKNGTESIPVGGGLHFSTDRGITWTFTPQPVDAGTVDTLTYGINRIRALAITVPQQNITYDVAVNDSAVWIASFAGMLRRSTNLGQTWERVILPSDSLDSISPTDTLDFDLAPVGGALGLRENLNHRVFSVFSPNDSVIWVGTAGGINRSTDGGIRWQKYSHQNQTQPISGNFVVAINHQIYQSRSIVWAATVNAVDPDEEQAVSYTEDDGATWNIALLGERAHNIAWKDSIVYVATDRGLFRSSDFGRSWLQSGSVYDVTNSQRFSMPQIYAVAVQGDTVWIGGPEGIASTIDRATQPFGSSWRVFRAYQPVGASSSTYSYPLPFSPDDETVRLHYGTSGTTVSVTIRIFDYAMQPVKTLIQHAPRSGSAEHDEIWNGRDEYDRIVSNGVYFYRIEIDEREAFWGKVLVLR